jgi:hypothetical protein
VAGYADLTLSARAAQRPYMEVLEMKWWIRRVYKWGSFISLDTRAWRATQLGTMLLRRDSSVGN